MWAISFVVSDTYYKNNRHKNFTPGLNYYCYYCLCKLRKGILQRLLTYCSTTVYLASFPGSPHARTASDGKLDEDCERGYSIPMFSFLSASVSPLPVAVSCTPLSNPENGVVELTGTAVRDTATYSCNQGFLLFGKGIRTCRADGAWNGKSPDCRGEGWMQLNIFAGVSILLPRLLKLTYCHTNSIEIDKEGSELGVRFSM